MGKTETANRHYEVDDEDEVVDVEWFERVLDAIDGDIYELAGLVASALSKNANLADLENLTKAKYNLKLPIITSVRTVVTAPITLSGTQNAGGLSLQPEDQVLVAGQASSSQNGPRIVKATAVWERTAEMPENGSVRGRLVLVTEGPYANTLWILSTSSPIVIGTDPQTWIPYPAPTNLGFSNLDANVQTLLTGVTEPAGPLVDVNGRLPPTSLPGYWDELATPRGAGEQFVGAVRGTSGYTRLTYVASSDQPFTLVLQVSDNASMIGAGFTTATANLEGSSYVARIALNPTTAYVQPRVSSGTVAMTRLTLFSMFDTIGTVVVSPPRAGAYVPHGWGQRAWKPKLAAQFANPTGGRLVAGVTGDSVSQGYNCSNPDTKAWAALMKAALQAVGGDGGLGYWPASYSDVSVLAFQSGNATFRDAYNALGILHTTATPGAAWTRGTAGPGNQSLNTSVSGATITTRPIRGTQIDYYVVENGVAGTWTVSLDGGAAVPVTPGAANVTVKRSFTNLAPGTHVLVFTYTGNGTVPLVWCGVRGLNASGVVVDNYSRYGAASTNFTDQYGMAWNGGSKQPSDLMVYSLGLNDPGASISGDTWMQNHRKMLNDALDGTGQTGAMDVIFLLQHIGKNDPTNNLYQDYLARARGLAEAYCAALVDMWPIYRNSWNFANSNSYWGSTATPGAAGTDNVHLSDLGQQAVWDVLKPIVMTTV